MINTIKIRLEIIRSVRATKFEMLDYNINLLSDAIENTSDPKIKKQLSHNISELRIKRQRYRDITEPYKTLLKQVVIKHDENNPILAHGWDAFTSVDWE